MSSAVQLSLTPEIGWCILLQSLRGPGEELAFDHSEGAPFFTADELSAHRELHGSYIRGLGRVVRVERHPPVEGANGLPTYVVL